MFHFEKLVHYFHRMEEEEQPSNPSPPPVAAAAAPTTTTTNRTSWPELLGSTNWENLLDPVDLSLLDLVLRSGDFCQVTYDSFNNDPHSKYCGACRYGLRNVLHKTKFPFADDYTVTHYIYATAQINFPGTFTFSLSREAWNRESNWIGYIAVSSDASAQASGRRDIFVAWRGTTRDLEWIDVLKPDLVPISDILSKSDDDDDDDKKAKVMEGWYKIYTSTDPKSPFNKSSARDQLFTAIRELVQKYKDEILSIVLVGHSLGASLAVLSAFDIVENGLSQIAPSHHFPVCAIAFGCPQVGNRAFTKRFETLPQLRVLRIKNKNDLIPLYPTGLLGYTNTGAELVIDQTKSPYLKDSKNASDWHNLQGILHALAGWNGEDKEFALRVKRSVALVNKSSEYLKDELLVPGSWWVQENKGMVLGEDGEWKMGKLDPDDLPVPPK